jgi:hypothetical protein
MERGSAKHGARKDEALAHETSGELGPGGSNREEWAAAEPPADDDPPLHWSRPQDRGAARSDTGESAATQDPANQDPANQDPANQDPANQDEAEMRRLQHDMAVANDWNPAAEDD